MTRLAGHHHQVPWWRGCANAVIALEGGAGTLSEIALAVKRGVPVISLGGWQVAGVVEARGPEEAVSEALRLGSET